MGGELFRKESAVDHREYTVHQKGVMRGRPIVLSARLLDEVNLAAAEYNDKLPSSLQRADPRQYAPSV